LTGPLDAAVLERSLQELIARHETLRTCFALQQDQPVQIVAPTLPFRLSVTDLRLLPAAAREAQACAIARAEARRPFDLRHPPLFNIQLLKLADAGHMLTDVAALVLALIAVWFGSRPATSSKTFGYYRLEIIAALVNGVALIVISLLIFYGAYKRWLAPPIVG